MTTTTHTSASRQKAARRRRLALRFHPKMLNGHPGNITPAAKKMVVRAVRAGLIVTSTTDGKHAPGSYHYTKPGEAVDFGLPGSLVGTERGRRRLVNFQRKEARKPARFSELFGPDNRANVKNGVVISLPEGSPLETLHDNHVHGVARW
jgi:hypothetical protein